WRRGVGGGGKVWGGGWGGCWVRSSPAGEDWSNVRSVRLQASPQRPDERRDRQNASRHRARNDDHPPRRPALFFRQPELRDIGPQDLLKLQIRSAPAGDWGRARGGHDRPPVRPPP